MAELMEVPDARDKRISNIEPECALLMKQLDEARNELCKARDDIELVRDQANELKLELERVKKDFMVKSMDA